MAQIIFNEPEPKENPIEYISVQIPGQTPLVAIKDLAQMLGCQLRRLHGGQLVVTPQASKKRS